MIFDKAGCARRQGSPRSLR